LTQFLRVTAVARFSHHNSVCPSVTRVDQSITVQARITKSSTSAAWRTLVSGSVKLFYKFESGHPPQGCQMGGRGGNLQFSVNKSL